MTGGGVREAVAPPAEPAKPPRGAGSGQWSVTKGPRADPGKRDPGLRPRPQRQERARELALVGILLGNGEQGEHLGTESALEASGNNYVYAYGPDWMARPSTWSAEIQQFLRLLGATYVLRVEMGRQFGFEVHRSRPSFRQFQAINHLVLFDNALRKYDSGQVAAGFQRALLVAGPETADTRPDLRKLNE